MPGLERAAYARGNVSTADSKGCLTPALSARKGVLVPSCVPMNIPVPTQVNLDGGQMRMAPTNEILPGEACDCASTMEYEHILKWGRHLDG